jgi:hypothetical protein
MASDILLLGTALPEADIYALHLWQKKQADEITALRARVAELEARIAAGKQRIGDLKAVHSRYKDGLYPPQMAVDDMEIIAFSVGCYLDGVPGQYLAKPDGASNA